METSRRFGPAPPKPPSRLWGLSRTEVRNRLRPFYSAIVDNGGDGAAIAAVQNSYAAGIDLKDWDLLRSCFTTDAEITFGWKLQLGPLDDFMAWAPPFHEPFAATLHQISTHLATVDGDSARATCYLHAVLVKAERDGLQTVFGMYHDDLVREDGVWRIRKRVFKPAWHQ